ncbi:type-F conjugative transfer system pilin assembly protein TrbC [Azospirillum sp. BE72]|uniref:type-F conjugative transfer system pilin assembly protein TrbC n=1 Tax=Azospirillum sp. BE72 TaxID=2817776 RepID=UPI002858E172|nr:type-F conjugative transfer system pilin assembly protein TrbC [Azospirillum sp. BE72]MDR6775624.1 type-F conjugative transfer system pilin assembly protein TrbC [Azospirillum sp. BE72]
MAVLLALVPANAEDLNQLRQQVRPDLTEKAIEAQKGEAQSFLDGVMGRVQGSGAMDDTGKWVRNNRIRLGGAGERATGGPLATESGVDLGELVGRYAGPMDEAQTAGQDLHSPLVFVSFSMPEAALKDLAEQTRRAGGALLFRGMVNNNITDTMAAMGRIVGEQGGAMLDPTMFRMFDVKVVPTIVVPAEQVQPCFEPRCRSAAPEHDRIAGNVTLFYALETIANAGGPGAARAAENLSKLRSAEP